MTADERLGRRLRAQRVIVWLQATTAIAAVVALAFSLLAFSNRLSGIQSERQRAGTASCYLDRQLLLEAEPASRHAQTLAFINSPGVPLHDCLAYGRKVSR